MVDGSLRLCSAGRATVLPQALLYPINDLLCAMGSDNLFLFEGYGLLLWLVVYQAAGILKSVLISSPTHQFSLMESDVSYRYSISLLEFPSLKNSLLLSCGFDRDSAASH